MALSQVKTQNPGNTILSGDWNSEFQNILNNPITLISPTTGPINFNLQNHTNLLVTALSASSGTGGQLLTLTSSGAPAWAVPFSPTGQCRLAYVTSSAIRLSPYQGSYLPIKTGSQWAMMQIPSTGIDLSSTATATSTTLYPVFCFNSSGTLLLTVSSSWAHATSTETGVEILSTDATRTFVGMCFTSTTANWFSTVGLNNLVASWFNRFNVGTILNFTADRTNTSTAFAEINTEIRNQFLIWANESAQVSGQGIVFTATAGTFNATAIAFDSTGTPDTARTGVTPQTVNSAYPVALSISKAGLSEGYHFATLLSQLSSVGTATYSSTNSANGVNNPTSLTTLVRV